MWRQEANRNLPNWQRPWDRPALQHLARGGRTTTRGSRPVASSAPLSGPRAYRPRQAHHCHAWPAGRPHCALLRTRRAQAIGALVINAPCAAPGPSPLLMAALRHLAPKLPPDCLSGVLGARTAFFQRASSRKRTGVAHLFGKGEGGGGPKKTRHFSAQPPCLAGTQPSIAVADFDLGAFDMHLTQHQPSLPHRPPTLLPQPFPCSGVVVACAPWLSAGFAASATGWGEVSVTRAPTSEGCNLLYKGGRSLRGTQRQQLHFSKVWRTRWIPWPERRQDSRSRAGALASPSHQGKGKSGKHRSLGKKTAGKGNEAGMDVAVAREAARAVRQTQPWQPCEAADSERPPKGTFTKHASRGCHYGRPRLRIKFLVCRLLMTSEPPCEEPKNGCTVHACCRLPAPHPHRGRRVGEAANPGPAEDQDNAVQHHHRALRALAQMGLTRPADLDERPGSPLSPPPYTLSEHTPLATPRGDSDGVAPTWPDANNDLAPPAPHTRSQLSTTDQDTLTAREMLGAVALPAAGDITPGYSPSAVEWHVGTGGAASSCQRRWDQRGPDRSSHDEQSLQNWHIFKLGRHPTIL